MNTSSLTLPKISKTQWGILLAIWIIVYFSYMYCDLLVISRRSIDLIEAIFQGNFRRYYELLAQARVGNDSMDYFLEQYWGGAKMGGGFLQLFPVMLWNFPLWIIEHLSGQCVTQSYLGLLWIKGYVLFWLSFCIILLLDIERENEFVVKYRDCFIFMILSSVFVIAYAGIIVHVYAMYCFLLLKMLQMSRDGKFKQFLIWSSVAIFFYSFFLFPFVLLLLIQRKNIIRLGICSVSVLLPQLFSIFFSKKMMHHFASGLKIHHDLAKEKLLFGNSIDLSVGSTTFFLIVFFGFALYTYLYCGKYRHEIKKETTMSCFFFLLLFFVFCETNPYWAMLLFPLFIIYIFENRTCFYHNMFFEMLISTLLILIYMIKFHQCFGKLSICSMVIPKIFVPVEELPVTFDSIIDDILCQTPLVLTILIAVFVASVGVCVYKHFGGTRKEIVPVFSSCLFNVRLALAFFVGTIEIFRYFLSIIYCRFVL